MTKSKRLLALFLALITVFSAFGISFSAAADDAEEPIPCRYSVIGAHASGISISGITATCSASMSASHSASLIIKMELQKKKSGKYETIKTWTDTKTGTHISASHKRSINVLATYRLKTTFTAGGESAVVYSYP